MKCLICGCRFTWTSWRGPAEPCDCGAEIDKDEAQRIDPAILRDLKAQWRKANKTERA